MSVVNVLLYGALASASGTVCVKVEAATVSDVLNSLLTLYGKGFHEILFDLERKPRRFINIYVNGRDYRFLNKLETQLAPNDEVSLIPAVSGG